MADETRDPEEAIGDVHERLEQGEEPSPDEREFLEKERVDQTGGDEAPGILSG